MMNFTRNPETISNFVHFPVIFHIFEKLINLQEFSPPASPVSLLIGPAIVTRRHSCNMPRLPLSNLQVTERCSLSPLTA